MGVDERGRHQLYEALGHAIGEEAATTLMENLPVGGAHDLATKDDVRLAKDELRLEMRAMGSELLATIRGETNSQTRLIVFTTIFSTLGAVFTAASLAFAAARI